MKRGRGTGAESMERRSLGSDCFLPGDLFSWELSCWLGRPSWESSFSSDLSSRLGFSPLLSWPSSRGGGVVIVSFEFSSSSSPKGGFWTSAPLLQNWKRKFICSKNNHEIKIFSVDPHPPLRDVEITSLNLVPRWLTHRWLTGAQVLTVIFPTGKYFFSNMLVQFLFEKNSRVSILNLIFKNEMKKEMTYLQERNSKGHSCSVR